MAKKDETTTVAEVKPAREKRVNFNNVAPSAVNAWTGSVTATIVESGEQVAFTFVTPELSERDARAIAAGYAARLSIAVSGKKAVDDIKLALTNEIKTLSEGTYTIRGGSTASQSSFSDTVISMALLANFKEVGDSCDFTRAMYDAIVADLPALVAQQAIWDAADDAGKKALVTASVAKTKRLVGFFKI